MAECQLPFQLCSDRNDLSGKESHRLLQLTRLLQYLLIPPVVSLRRIECLFVSYYLLTPQMFFNWISPCGHNTMGEYIKIVLTSNEFEVIYTVSYTHLRAHETRHDLVCRLLLEKK